MNIHEYQAKEIMRKYGIAVPNSQVAFDVEGAADAARQLDTGRFVVKAQVHAGGRGKAGGVKIVDSVDAVKDAAAAMLGTHLVTFQTDEKGQPVHSVLVEAPSNIANELYLGAVVDRAEQKIIFMASTEGGMEIETVAEESPEKILKAVVDPLLGLQPYQAKELFFKLDLDKALLRQFTKLMLNMYDLFVGCDLGMLEINPLVVTAENELVCLDGKFNIDDNALYRHADLREMRDPTQEEESVNHAQEWELNYVPLDGNIGCMVNGAGLAMATMDLIKLVGGEPANFLDVGGGATKERVTEAFKIILSDSNVKGILVNIFGGIVRCDMIAEGIIGAVKEADITVPVVVRLAGTNAELGAEKLAQSGLKIIPAAGFTEAAERIVSAVKETL